MLTDLESLTRGSTKFIELIPDSTHSPSTRSGRPEPEASESRVATAIVYKGIDSVFKFFPNNDRGSPDPEALESKKVGPEILRLRPLGGK